MRVHSVLCLCSERLLRGLHSKPDPLCSGVASGRGEGWEEGQARSKTVKGLLGESVGASGTQRRHHHHHHLTIIVKTESSYASQTALKLLGLPSPPTSTWGSTTIGFHNFYPLLLLSIHPSFLLPSPPPSSVKVDEVPRECVLLT